MASHVLDPQLHVLLRVRALQAIVYGEAKPDSQDDPLLLHLDDDATEPGAQETSRDVGGERERASASAEQGMPPIAHQTRGSLALRTQRAQEQLDMFVKQEEAQAISTFLAHYDRDAAYLSPSFLLSGFLPYADSQLSFSDQASLSSSLPATSIGGTPIAPESQLSLMLELAPVWRTFAVQLEECDVLERRGVLQIFPASSMTVTATASSNEWPLKPASSRANGDAEKQIVEMDMCLSVFSEGKQAQLIREQQALEKRLAAFLDTYSNYVDSMSQLFVQWDQAMLDMERSVNRLEVQQRRRLEAISA